MKKILFSLLAVLTLEACDGMLESDQPAPAPVIIEPPVLTEIDRINLSEQELTYVGPVNDFAFNIYNKVAEPGRSTLLSPMSVAVVLDVMSHAATGETRQEIVRALGLDGISQEAADHFFNKLAVESQCRDRQVMVGIHSAIFLGADYLLSVPFYNWVAASYQTLVKNLDFTRQEQALKTINEWSDAHTAGMVPTVLDQVSPVAIAYVLNAICLEAPWASQFSEEATGEVPFTGYDGTVRPVPTMRQTASFDCLQTDGFAMLTLPYGRGAYEMTLLLPDEGRTTADVMEGMTARRWKQLRGQMQPALLSVSLPRFETDAQADLREVLMAMGVKRAFDEYSAEFPYFCRDERSMPFISHMQQNAHIEVYEKGTKAAATTVAGVAETSVGEEPKAFRLDRPFVYVISESSTGSIFFVGQYGGE